MASPRLRTLATVSGVLALAIAAYVFGIRDGKRHINRLGFEARAQLPERSNYYPNTERLGADEMRVIALGTGMRDARRGQASACWLVQLGNDESFLFDIGTGCMGNLASLEIPYDQLDKVFITHLHADHVGDLAALWISGWVGNRKKPLEVWGPDGAIPEQGTAAALRAMQAMYRWDVDGRRGTVQSEGGQVVIHEFDHTKLSTVYDQNGVTIQAWPAIHVLEGPVSYSLEWKDRKFVFSGDTYPNKWFIEYAQNADIVVLDSYPTIRQLIELRGVAPSTAAVLGTRSHTPPAATGKVFSLVKPRHAIAYHFYNDFQTRFGIQDEIRETYDGPLSLAMDMMVWNVSDAAITVRDVVAPEAVWPPPSDRPPISATPQDRIRSAPWMWEGAYDIENVIKDTYERQGVAGLYTPPTDK